MIKYSLRALEDLAKLKADLMVEDAVYALVKITGLVDQIGNLPEGDLEAYKVFQGPKDTYYYKDFGDQVVFFRCLDEEIFIDRIFNRDLDFISLALDF